MKEVLIPLIPGTRKTAVVVIGDGLDRGSKLPFEKVLGELESENITLTRYKYPTARAEPIAATSQKHRTS